MRPRGGRWSAVPTSAGGAPSSEGTSSLSMRASSMSVRPAVLGLAEGQRKYQMCRADKSSMSALGMWWSDMAALVPQCAASVRGLVVCAATVLTQVRSGEPSECFGPTADRWASAATIPGWCSLGMSWPRWSERLQRKGEPRRRTAESDSFNILKCRHLRNAPIRSCYAECP